MREIDTDALHGVARSLGVGNPATATRQVVFDDENLQQVWDAQRYARLPQLTAGMNASLAALAGTLQRGAISRSALFTRGEYDATLRDLGLSDPADTDVYVVGLQVLTDLSDSANMLEIQAGARQQLPEQIATAVRLWQTPPTQIKGDNSLEAGNDLVLANNSINYTEEVPGILPIRLEGQGVTGADPDVLFHLVEAGAGGGCSAQFHWKLHFCPKGVPIWYAL